jgi:Bacterial Ig domain
MTEDRRPSHSGATRPLAWLSLLLAGVLLQACQPAPPAGSRLRVYAADVTGAAKSCDVPQISPAVGQTTEAAVKLVNDGGWCGLPVHQDGPKPYDAGLLTVRPAHGNVLIHGVGDDTRIDYTPDRGFSGTDSFSVKLVPGNATIHVAVAVTPPAK